MSKNPRFRLYNLTVNTDKVMFFLKILEIRNAPHIDNLCQVILYMMYNMLTVTSQNNTNQSAFEKYIRSMMQTGKGVVLDVIFLKNMKLMYSNDYTIDAAE